jgi:TatD DNase family protein
MGFYISFSGVLTFKSATELQEVARQIPLERILVETDSPYLSPVPFRGKPNFPANTLYVAEKLAELRGISLQEIAETTTHNFKTLFRL